MEPTETKPNASEAINGKYLTFKLGTEEFGVQILKVREIIAMQEITPIPSLPAAVKGVINLRGGIIPVVDLRLQLGLTADEFDRNTCIVVTEVQMGSEDDLLQIGCVVNAVNEVLTVSESVIEPPPSFGQSVDVGTLLGIAKIVDQGKVVALLDIDCVLDSIASQAQELESEELAAAQ